MSNKAHKFKHEVIINFSGISRKFDEDKYSFMEKMVIDILKSNIVALKLMYKTLKIDIEIK